MFGSAMLDVVIGLVFSLVRTALCEGLESRLKSRVVSRANGFAFRIFDATRCRRAALHPCFFNVAKR